jgi:hypothetical protein
MTIFTARWIRRCRKMEKEYYHPHGRVTQEGVTQEGATQEVKIMCGQCGILLDETLKSKTPCSIPMAATSIFKGYEFEVDVWNCAARLLVFRAERSGGSEKRKYFDLDFKNKETRQRLDELVEGSVYAAGGMINRSGIYPLSDELEAFIETGFGETITIKVFPIKVNLQELMDGCEREE